MKTMFKKLTTSKALKRFRKTSNVKIRTLTNGDLKKLSDLFEKYAEQLGMEAVRRIISTAVRLQPHKNEPESTALAEQVISIGVEILKKISSIGKTEVAEFFADLIGVTIEEFWEMPMNTPLMIIDQIRTAPEAEGFFMISSLVSKVTDLSGNPLELLKDWFDSTLEEVNQNS